MILKCSTCATGMLTVNADAGSEDASEGRYRRARNIRNALPTGSSGRMSPFAYDSGRLANHVSRVLILAQPDKRGVEQVIVRCPFCKFDLDD